jgi:hypothetical protein
VVIVARMRFSLREMEREAAEKIKMTDANPRDSLVM